MSDLYEITATAANFAHQQDYANAAAIYEVVAVETMNHYHSSHDEDGAFPKLSLLISMVQLRIGMAQMDIPMES